MSTKKRPSKESYDRRTRVPGDNPYDCWKCRARTLVIYYCVSDWVSEDRWLCPTCYAGLDKKPEENKPDYYEGLTVFPLLNGLK